MALAYELAFAVGPKHPKDLIRATLTSQHLDHVLHPDGSLLAVFATRSAGPRDEFGFVLCSSELDAVTCYLELQSRIRMILERELSQDRANWLGMDDDLGPACIWEHARASYILIEPTQPHEPMTHQKPSSAEGISGCAGFTLCFEVDWDEEHGVRTASFRDGQFVEIGIEG